MSDWREDKAAILETAPVAETAKPAEADPVKEPRRRPDAETRIRQLIANRKEAERERDALKMRLAQLEQKLVDAERKIAITPDPEAFERSRRLEAINPAWR